MLSVINVEYVQDWSLKKNYPGNAKKVFKWKLDKRYWGFYGIK